MTETQGVPVGYHNKWGYDGIEEERPLIVEPPAIVQGIWDEYKTQDLFWKGEFIATKTSTHPKLSMGKFQIGDEVLWCGVFIQRATKTSINTYATQMFFNKGLLDWKEKDAPKSHLAWQRKERIYKLSACMIPQMMEVKI